MTLFPGTPYLAAFGHLPSSGVLVLEPLQEEIRTLHAILGSERDPDGRAFAPLADAYRRAGEPRKAFGLLTDGLARLPDFVSGHVVAAKLYGEQGLLEEGEMAARKALELDPENVRAMASLVAVLERAERHEEAREVRETLVALEPEVLAEEGLAPADPVAGVGLAPAEAALDIADLAPEAGPAEAVEPAGSADLVDVVPDEPVLDLEDLAPVEIDSGDPDRASEETLVDIGALAPDEPAEEAPIDIGALAPEEPAEEVADIGAFAPEEPAEEVADIGALAPDEPVPSVADLAPDEVPSDAGESVATTARAEPPEQAAHPSPAASVTPAEDGMDGPPAPPNPSGDASEEGAPRIYTRTLGELYAKQGFLDRAVEVFRQLRSENPEDGGLAARLAELEEQAAGGAVQPAPETTPSESAADAVEEEDEEASRAAAESRDEELEALAKDLVERRESPDEAVDTPFAWTEETDADEDARDSEPDTEQPIIGRYFEDLLSWQPTRRS
ncbi:MAG: hypothetical protein U5R14_10340 [Gemmatimonadota bacterium]|nr:hypothetical protein [Gemmatimonadota bacterium]